jgi:RNA polymerase sigma-70 factor (ECF subfamily)
MTMTVSVVMADVIHARYAARIRRRVNAVLGPDDDRDDLVQDVLETAIRKIGTLREPACLDAWVAQVTNNTLKYFLRRRRLRRHASLEALAEGDLPSCHGSPDAREIASRVVHVIKRLPDGDRLLLTRYWFSPATAECLAEEAGCSGITLRRRLARARNRFEKLARSDPGLAPYFEATSSWWTRWRSRPLDADASVPRSRGRRAAA